MYIRSSVEGTVLGYRRLGRARSCEDSGRISKCEHFPSSPLYSLKEAGGDRRRKFSFAKSLRLFARAGFGCLSKPKPNFSVRVHSAHRPPAEGAPSLAAVQVYLQ